MSQVRGTISRGKDDPQQLSVDFKAKLTPEQWADFVEKLGALVKSYNPTDYNVKGPGKT